MPRWRVDLIGIEAATEREAIEAAIKIFQVEPSLRQKLMATKVRD
jgi:hypothetical protein